MSLFICGDSSGIEYSRSTSKFIKQFWLNLLHTRGKCFPNLMAIFSHFQMDYHFNFGHNRRNSFCCTVCGLIWAHYKAFSISIIIICVHSHPMIAPFFWENLTPYFYCSVVSQRLLQTFRFIISLYLKRNLSHPIIYLVKATEYVVDHFNF